MKKLAVLLAAAIFAGNCLPEIATAEISSRDARQLRLAARKAPKVKPPTATSLAEVCTSIETLSGNQLFKSQGSGHLARDPRGDSCAWIYGSGNYSYPKKINNFKFYDSNGAQLTYLRVYERGGCPFPFRAYTDYTARGPSCNQIAARAVANTGNRQGYIAIGGGKCLKINSIIGRQGGNRAGTITSNKAQCRKR
ncbi:MAG: hypothetical protein J0M12_06665 [Deltaproteobacteria bacterium]|nr:hypothetical protein [Deltaproteobacteria bacterium]